MTTIVFFFALLLSYVGLDAMICNLIDGIRGEDRMGPKADVILMLLICALWTAFYYLATHP